jgi:hypothetical protein
MSSKFIAMIHYSHAHSVWLHLTGWEAPVNDRDTMSALRQIEEQTDEVVEQRGEPAFTPFVLLAGSLATGASPHVVRKAWRLSPDLADRLLSQVEERGADEAIEEALSAWAQTRAEHGDDALSLDLDDYLGLDFQDLTQRAYPPAN